MIISVILVRIPKWCHGVFGCEVVVSNRSSCLVRLVVVEHLWLLVLPALMPVESQPHSWGAWLGTVAFVAELRLC